MVLRESDPSEWSYERVEDKNSKGVERLYRGYVRSIIKLCKMDWDYPILVTGREGGGKSSWAINLGVDLDDDIEKNLEEHVFFHLETDFSSLMHKMTHSPPSVFIIDEAGVDLFSRNSMQTEQKQLVSLFIIMRQFNHIPILCLPKQRWLDSYLRDHRVVSWINVTWKGTEINRERGYAHIRMAQHGEFSDKPYWEYLFTYRFPDFPKSIEQRYKEIKRKHAMERYGPDRLDQREKIVIDSRGRGMTYQEIAKFLGVTHPTVMNIEKKAKAKMEVVT